MFFLPEDLDNGFLNFFRHLFLKTSVRKPHFMHRPNKLTIIKYRIIFGGCQKLDGRFVRKNIKMELFCVFRSCFFNSYHDTKVFKLFLFWVVLALGFEKIN